jgi:beta-glucanase (GH16 family)
MRYWSCTLTEDFDSSTLNRRLWSVQTTAASGYGHGGDCYVDSANNIAIRNGALELTTRKEAAPFTCQKPTPGQPGVKTDFQTQWTTATVMTDQKFSQAFGRFEIRAKMPATTVPGLQFAYWLWPQDMLKYGYQWPMSGELDTMEWYSQYADRGIPSIHYWHTAADPNTTNYYCVLGDMSQWHTFTLEWTPQAIRMLYDGNTCLVNTNWQPSNGITKPAPFDHPFMVALTQGLGVTGSGNAVNANTPSTNTAIIDYVYVWA